MLLDMTEGKPIKLLIPFMLPLLLGNLFQQFYNIADVIIVGRTIGVEALAAVGAVSPLFFMQVVLTIGMSNGFTVVTGQRYGAGNMDGVRRSIATSIVLSSIFTLALMFFMAWNMDWLMKLMHVPSILLDDAKSYILVITYGLAAMTGYNLLSSIMRSLGDSKTPLYFLILSSLVNILLALIFILWLGWGVPGSAVALVVAQALSAILCLGYIYRKFPQLHLQPQDWYMDGAEAWEHLCMGLPMSFQFVVLGFSIMVLQAVCNQFEPEIIAGFTAAVRVEQLALQPMLSFGIFMAVYTAQNFGAKRFDRIRAGVKTCSCLSLVFSGCAMLALALVGRQIVAVFIENPSTVVLDAAYTYILYTVPAYFFLSQVFIYRNVCQGMGVGLIPFFAGCVELVARSWGALTFTEYWGFRGLCLASPLSWLCCAIFVAGSYWYFVNLLEKKWLARP